MHPYFDNEKNHCGLIETLALVLSVYYHKNIPISCPFAKNTIIIIVSQWYNCILFDFPCKWAWNHHQTEFSIQFRNKSDIDNCDWNSFGHVGLIEGIHLQFMSQSYFISSTQ